MPRASRVTLVLIAAVFFAWGILRALNDVLAASFQLRRPFHDSEAMLIHFSFFAAYFLFPIPAAAFARRFGLRAGLPAAAALMALGAALCALSLHRDLYILVLPLFLSAAGIAVLQTTASPSITLLGPAGTAGRRFLIAQGFASLGSVFAPIAALGHARYLPIPALSANTRALVLYATTAALLLGLGVALALVRSPQLGGQPAQVPVTTRAILQYRHLRFAALAIFLYVGTEATILSHIITYFSQVRTGRPIAVFQGSGLSVYWIMIMLGRILAVTLVRRARLVAMLRTAALGAAALLVAAILFRSHVGGAALFLTGLANAVIFPLIYTLATARLTRPELTAASGVLVTAICGGAILPYLSATLADHTSFFAVFALPVACYLWIAATARRNTLIAV